MERSDRDGATNLPPVIGRCAALMKEPRRDLRSAEAKVYRHWYWQQRWRRKAKAQLRAQPLCERCEARGDVTAASIANHKIPHQGDATLFWQGELESVCKRCHDGDIQLEESRGHSNEIGSDGFPLDPRHPWNRTSMG